jgi:IclR family transcriptional regulator, KDG regulon repressor
MKPATTITKVCRVLEEFRSRPSIGVSDLARRTDLLPSDVHRILTSLQYCGYIDQDPETKRYRLGCGLLKLGLIAGERIRLRAASRPLLQRISEELDATALLAMFDRRELEVFLVEQIDCPGESFLKPGLGSPSGPHCTALGKTIMACMDRETTLRAVNKSGMPRMTSHTITDMAVLEDEFAKIRQQGYSTDHEESIKGACCLAAPVRDHTGAVVAAISASLMTDHFFRKNESRLASVVKSAAAELSASIGYEAKSIGKPRAPVRRGLTTPG